MKTKIDETNYIRRLMGLNLLSEQQVSFPVSIRDKYTASNCDELHAFQSTGGVVIGNMNVIVGDELKRLYELGYNPKVTKVNVDVNKQTVNWEVIIDKSEDGNAWLGFTSRGAGCNNDIVDRSTSRNSGNDVESLKNNIIKAGLNKDGNFKLEKVNDYIYDGGENSFKQVFYRYNRPNDYPQHSNQNINNKDFDNYSDGEKTKKSKSSDGTSSYELPVF